MRKTRGMAEDATTLALPLDSEFASLTPKPVASSAEGHRARMRGKLLTAGPDALLDHELLEMQLFLALPRRDTKPIARAHCWPASAASAMPSPPGRRNCDRWRALAKPGSPR
jgi:DNA repair protein RadC